MDPGSLDRSPTSWTAQLVLRKLHAADGPLTAVNLAGRCFLPSHHVVDALRELQQVGLVSRRGRRWRPLERRARDSDRRTARRRERRFPAA